MKRAILLSLVGLWLKGASVLVPSAFWYVDSVHGSDSNLGTSANQSFLTISHLLAQTINSTTPVALGSPDPAAVTSWNEEVNVNIPGLQIIGYGATQPLIDCSSPISSGSWTKTGGFTNVYQITGTFENTDPGFVRVWENNVTGGLPRVASIAAVDATPGSYFPSADPTGSGGTISITIYVQATTGNPTSNGLPYADNPRLYAINNLATGSKIINIHGRRNLGNNGSLVCYISCNMIDDLAEDGAKHNAFNGPGSYIYRSTARNSYYGGQLKILWIYNANSPAGQPVTYDTVTAALDAFDSNTNCYDGHNNIGGFFGAITWINSSATNCGVGFAGGAGTSEILINPTGTGNGTSIDISQPPVAIHGGSMTGATNHGIAVHADGSIVIDQGAVISTTAAFPSFFIQSSNKTALTINNATIGNSYYGVFLLGSGSSLSVHNTTNQSTTYGYQLGAGYTLNSDFNAFAQNALNFYLNGPSYSTLGAYKAATGQDQHSTP